MPIPAVESACHMSYKSQTCYAYPMGATLMGEEVLGLLRHNRPLCGAA